MTGKLVAIGPADITTKVGNHSFRATGITT